METLKATRMLKGWVDKGLLVTHGSGKKDTTYSKPNPRDQGLFSLFEDVKLNNLKDSAPLIDTESEIEKRPANVRKSASGPPPRKDKNPPKKRTRK